MRNLIKYHLFSPAAAADRQTAGSHPAGRPFFTVTFLLAAAVLLSSCGRERENRYDPESPVYSPSPVADRQVRLKVDSPIKDNGGFITEGTSIDLALSLADRPSSNAELSVELSNEYFEIDGVKKKVLIFSPDNFATAQTVTLSALGDIDLVNNETVLTINSKVTEEVTYDLVNADKDSLNIIPAGPATLVEGQAGQLKVSLTRQPASAVEVSLAHNGGARLALDRTTLVFGPENYDLQQVVEMTSAEDADVFADDISITISAAGADNAVFNLTINDNDTGIILSAASGNINEGDQTSLDISLAGDPGGPVTLDLYLGDYSTFALSTYQLQFDPANYSIPQSISVYAQNDVNLVNEMTTLTAAVERLKEASVVFSSVDADTQGILIEAASSLAEGSSMFAAVSLTRQPAEDVVIDLSTDISDAATVNPAQLTFTPQNYALAQNVTLNAPEEADGESEEVTLSATSSGINTSQHTFTVIDNEAAVLFSGATSVVEGGTATLSVYLSKEIGAGVTVNLVSDDPGVVSLSTSSLYFPAGSSTVAQNVTLNGISDSDDTSSQASISATGINLLSAARTVTNLDNTRSLSTFAFLAAENAALSSDVNPTLGATIEATLSFATDVTALVPVITFDGASVSPASGAATDFSDDTVVTVYADSGNSTAYTVRLWGHDLQDNGNGTVSIHYQNQTWVWKKCVQGTDPLNCSGLADYLVWCWVPSNACQSGTILNTTSSEVYNSCNSVNGGGGFGGYNSGWRVPYADEMHIQIAVNDRYGGSYTPMYYYKRYWTIEAYDFSDAIFIYYPDNVSYHYAKTNTDLVRCVRPL